MVAMIRVLQLSIYVIVFLTIAFTVCYFYILGKSSVKGTSNKTEKTESNYNSLEEDDDPIKNL